ncbi:BppU family phage baseplate upper protein [Lactococcus sp. LG606]|uniref:BppU family phage baseplate upper protein n=1 Tax=Lactococcus sp. LG606 TaxID=2816912 RepID=UPI001A8C3B42|nr:BppU family phage baseplate upper protein [Lactococcus sp. LG606]QSR12820.1 BppU family phage baseplate upper protein [Lactococcus sp. LG606]
MTDYNLTLSTTEANSVGMIKLRHADTNSQILKVQVIENGIAKKFTGLTPFFCLMAQSVTGQGVSEEPVKTFNSDKGTLEYIASDNALQMIGRNEAYFSFRKQTGTEWVEQFSTRSFYFVVEKSIYSQPFKDSNYWWTFKELNRIFNQYIEDGKNSWEEFVEANREILESIDPGGRLLAEVLDLNPLKNKKIVMFGDSIIDLGTIPSEIKTLSGATEVYNVGFGGCTMTPTDTIGGGYDKFSMHALATAVLANDFTAQTTLATTTLGGFLAHLNTLKAIDFATIDICFISYGTNDFGFNVNSGTADVVSNLTVAGAMKEVVNKLQSKNPNMEIIFTTPVYRADKFLNTLNLPLSVYADTIKSTAGRLGTKVIDLHTCSGINEFNYTTLLKAADKLHPVAAGNTLMAKAFVKYARGGYVGRTDNKFEPLTVGVNLAQDSEKFNVHNPNNAGAFYGGKSYITHAPKSYMKYTDIVLCDCPIELTGVTTIKIVFDAIIKGCQGSVNAILYDSANTQVAVKTATLNINETEANYVTNHVMGNFTGVYRLYVAIKAMDVAPEIYIRNPLILQKNHEKVSVGATTVTVSGSPLSVKKSVIYTDYNNWAVDYIPVVMANSQYTDLIVSVANFYNHFDVTITTKKGEALTAGDYVINYVRFLP